MFAQFQNKSLSYPNQGLRLTKNNLFHSFNLLFFTPMLQQHSQRRDIVKLRSLVGRWGTILVGEVWISPSLEKGDNIGQVAVLAGICQRREASPGLVVDLSAQ